MQSSNSHRIGDVIGSFCTPKRFPDLPIGPTILLNMTDNQNAFTRLDTVLGEGGPAAVLDQLIDTLESQDKHHELFEALKMKLRHGLGLPLRYNDSGDELDEATRQGLEEGLIEACRHVGTRLLESGKLREGWMYLRPVGDNNVIRNILADQQPTEDNLDEHIELCLQEGLDLRRGFELMLSHYGTCNSITTYESSMYGQPRVNRQIGAELLVNHLHQELFENVAGHIEREEEKAPTGTTLAELVEGRDWLFQDGSYHIDTTHLSSVVRFARDLDDAASLQLAVDLAAYGDCLDEQLQYPSEAPFAEFYPAHRKYLNALIGNDVEEAVAYYREQAETCDPYEHSTIAIEVYLDLLARLSRNTEAIQETVRLLPDNLPTTGMAPSLLDLSEACQSFEQLKQTCRQKDDLVGYTLGLLNSQKSPEN